jgi:phosphoesterase RecJ-like protein
MTEAATADARIAEALLAAESVVVCAHVDPDGDAIGSVLAMTLALRRAGVAVRATLADDRGVPVTYGFLPGAELFVPVSGLTAPDVFLALDAPSFERLGVAEPLARSARLLLVVDHHHDNSGYGDVNLTDAAAPSTASIVWRLLPRLGVEPDAGIATGCYAGLVTDTGRFSYSNTTPEALRDGAAMIEAGADPASLFRRIYESRSAGSLALLGRVLSRIVLANGGRVAYSWISDADLTETGALPEETENLVDAVRQTAGIEVAVFFKADATRVKLSLRAKCPTLDVSAVARAFGGGGHAAAAGAAIEAPLDEAVASVLALLPGAGS